MDSHSPIPDIKECKQYEETRDLLISLTVYPYPNIVSRTWTNSERFIFQVVQKMARHRKASKKRTQSRMELTPRTTPRTRGPPIPISLADPDPPLRVEITMGNKSDNSHDKARALQRLDAAFYAISYPLNSDGEWEQWEEIPTAVQVVIWKKDKCELEEYEDVTDDDDPDRKQNFEAELEKGASIGLASEISAGTSSALFNIVIWKTCPERWEASK